MDFKWKLINTSYESSAIKMVKENTPDAGGNFKRQSVTSQEDIINGFIIVDTQGREEFREFYLRDTQQGEIPFNFYDPTLGENRPALFNSGISENKVSDHFKIAFSLRLGRPSGAAEELWYINGSQLLLNGEEAILRRKRW